MFLSCLLIDIGDNPDRPRPGRIWLRNLYHVHQRLCMAFPSDPRKTDDRDFLALTSRRISRSNVIWPTKRKPMLTPEILKQVTCPRASATPAFSFALTRAPAGGP